MDDHRAGKIVVALIGRVNKTGVISPRFDVGLGDIEKWVNNLLPSRQFGCVLAQSSTRSFLPYLAASEDVLYPRHRGGCGWGGTRSPG